MNELSVEGSGCRLNKYIALCGICSRRDADKLIEDGHIDVNGERAVSGMKISESDTVTFDGRVITPAVQKTVLAFNKPVGVVCTDRDAHAEKTVADVLDHPVRLHYAGRLDKDTSGLLIMTDDGDLIEHLMRGSNGHEKVYIVKVLGKITDDALDKMRSGIYLDELDETTRPCDIELLTDNRLKMTLTQGLNRQIKRMCRAVGLKVIRLKRIRVANIELGDLKPGQYREITGEELHRLYEIAGM